ncbi:MAG: hypothetical protein ACXWKG_04950, partial [Limisphaerales bacterium]
LISCVLQIHASPGEIDPTFGAGGKVVVRFVYQAYANGIVLQPDGKILLFGNCNYGDYINRLNADGSFDSTFGSKGMLYSQNYATCSALSLASDGKLIAAGSFHTISRDYFSIRRYATNGTLDTSFATGGSVTTDMGYDGGASSVLVQRDGKIILAGHSTPGTNQMFAIARYLSNGDLDYGFAQQGRLFVDFGQRFQRCAGAAMQADGKLVFVGDANTYSDNSRVALVRCTPNGALDPTFNQTGKVASDFGSACAAHSVAIQSDGKIVVGGWANLACLLVRYNVNGTLDTSFGPNGTGAVATAVGTWDSWSKIILQPDGKILAVGQTATYDQLVVGRFNQNGVLDNTFGANGIVRLSLGTLRSTGVGLALQPNGKLLVTGTQTDGSVKTGVQTNSLAVVRLDNDAIQPPTVSCSAPSVIDCAQLLNESAVVNNPGGGDCSAVWTVNGVAVQTNTITGSDGAVVPISFSSSLTVRSNLVAVVVTDSHGQAGSCANQVLAHDTTAPTLVLVPTNTTAQCDAVPAVSRVAALDDCDANPTVSFVEQLIPGRCANQFAIVRTWTAIDASGNATSAQQTIAVSDTKAPTVSHVPPDVTVSCDAIPMTAMPEVRDNCDGHPSVVVADVSTQAGSGVAHDNYGITRTWTATDTCGNSTEARQQITVIDTSPPFVKYVSATPSSIWPPNDGLVPVRIEVNAIDNCSTVVARILEITCNEISSGDWQITGDLSAVVRARRLGKGDGRVYTFKVKCTDVSGNATTVSVPVIVGHDQSSSSVTLGVSASRN